MMGPLCDAIVEAARKGLLTKPHEITEDDWRARLTALYPDLTPEAIASARADAEALWGDAGDDDFGI